mgnify:CR=1 FL=1
MHLARTLATIAVATLLASPAPARPANPAAKLSLDISRASQPIAGDTKANSIGGAALPLLLVGLAAAVGAALLLGDNDSKPASN